MDKHHWLLLAIGLSDNGLSPVQTQKTMFLLGKEAGEGLGEGAFYAFIPYDYGPFDSAIYGDVEELVRQGFLTREGVPGRSWSISRLTPEGQKLVEELRESGNSAVVTYLGSVVNWVTSQSFSGLLRAIYAKYPDYQARSVFSG